MVQTVEVTWRGETNIGNKRRQRFWREPECCTGGKKIIC